MDVTPVKHSGALYKDSPVRLGHSGVLSNTTWWILPLDGCHSGALYKGSPDAGNMELVHFSFCLQGIIGFTLSPLVEHSERNSGPRKSVSNLASI